MTTVFDQGGVPRLAGSSDTVAGGGAASLSIATVSPVTAVESTATALTVTGEGFVSGSVIFFNGIAQTTTYGSSTSLTCTVPTTDMTPAGNVTVYVENPAPTYDTSGTQNFLIVAAAVEPQVNSLTAWNTDVTGGFTSTPKAMTLPTHATGDLILVLGTFNSYNATSSAHETYCGGSAWTKISEAEVGGNSQIDLEAWYLVAASGAETLEISADRATEGVGCFVVIDAGTFDPTPEIEAQTATGGPNPPSITPTWGAHPQLAMALWGCLTYGVVSGYPTDYDENQFTQGESTGASSTDCGFAVAMRTDADGALSSFDPSAFTDSESDSTTLTTTLVVKGTD